MKRASLVILTLVLLLSSLLVAAPASAAEPEMMVFYPVADGVIRHAELYATWEDLLVNGTQVYDEEEDEFAVLIQSHIWGYWLNNIRAEFIFDTSELAGNKIVAATLMVYGTEKRDTLGIEPDVGIYTASPADYGDISLDDYDTMGTEPIGNIIAYDDLVVGDYNSFDLTPAGLRTIGDYACLALRNANYDTAEVEPSWSGQSQAGFEINFTEAGANIPMLVVYYR